MVFSCERFKNAGVLDLVVALAVVGLIQVISIVSRWLFPCPACKSEFFIYDMFTPVGGGGSESMHGGSFKRVPY